MTQPELLALLVVSVLLQTWAAWIALHQMAAVSGRYRLAWGFISLALALMVQRRAAPLWRLIMEGQASNFADTLFGLAISLCMAIGMFGIRRLFTDMREQGLRLDALARTDALTGLPNRREILERLDAEVERSMRSRQPVSVLMVDIDHFKQVNDTYGHPVGDRLLQAIGQAGQESLRRIDSCGRIGGEEFLVLLPQAGAAEALVAAERLRTAIAERCVTVGNQQLQATVSIGVATHQPDDLPLTAEQLMLHADQALYAAKAGGRNRVMTNQSSTRSMPPALAAAT